MCEAVSNACREEISQVDRLSSITNSDVSALLKFTDKDLCTELDEICPILSHALKGATSSKLNQPEDDKYSYRVQCYGILFKGRFPNSRYCIISHRNDQLFVAAGAKKKAFKWFNKFGITNSYFTALKKNRELAKNHDDQVL